MRTSRAFRYFWPRLATERAWYTPLLVIGAVALLLAVYAVLLWVVAARGSG
jgi:hypothetical protein